ncbi:TPA: hypothetical protein P0E36_005234 [Vibrio harveyi]|nr:hypothetical protein [Vibrio harveyi]
MSNEHEEEKISLVLSPQEITKAATWYYSDLFEVEPDDINIIVDPNK